MVVVFFARISGDVDSIRLETSVPHTIGYIDVTIPGDKRLYSKEE